MKKITLLFVMVFMIVLGLSLKSNAELGSTVTQNVNVNDLYKSLSLSNSSNPYTGITYKNGLIGNYRVVETVGIADLRTNQKICGLTDFYEVNSNSMTVNRKYINTDPTFVAFSDTSISDAYGYTLLYGLGLCTNEKTGGGNKTDLKFYSPSAYKELSSTSIVTNNSFYNFKNIPVGKQGAQLVLMGDVIVTRIIIRNFQKLWTGNQNNFTDEITVYICCNTYEAEYFE